MKSSSSPARPDRLVEVPLDKLHAHPLNSNQMPPGIYAGLLENISRTGEYPPVIVRPHTERAGEYQILDGHNRVSVLRELGHAAATCFNWPCDDDAALLLLATLNRLEGHDVPAKRADLLAELTRLVTPEDLALLLPEDASQIEDTLALIDLDVDRMLADLEAAAEQEMNRGPRLLSFAVDREDEAEIMEAIDAAAMAVAGKNRRGKALALICAEYLGDNNA